VSSVVGNGIMLISNSSNINDKTKIKLKNKL